MNGCIEGVLSKLKQHTTVIDVDTEEYEELKLYGILKFHVKQYEIEDLGNLSIMKVNMGFMQMATVVITPRDKNMPLLSADYMYILGNRKAYLEFYDVVKEKDQQYDGLLNALVKSQEKWKHLENLTPSEAWYDHLLTVTAYKAGDKNSDKDLQELLVESLEIYLEHADDFLLLTGEDREEKIKITQEYTDGLIEKGGISTDVFKDALGEKETKRFFDQVFFGTLADKTRK